MDETVKNKFPDLGQSWTLIGIFFIMNLCLSVIPVVLKLAFKIESSWVTTIIFLFSFIFTFFFVKVLNKEYSFKESIKLKSVPIYVYLFILIIVPFLGVILDYLVSFIPMPEFVEKLFKEAFTMNVPTIIMAVILAPILEELLCRGVILQGLLKNMTPIKALMHTAIIFAVLHMNPWQGIPAFIIGFIMAWLVWKTGSILPAIFLHFVNNGFACFLTLYFGDDVTLADLLGKNHIYGIMVSLIIVISLGYYLYQKIEYESENRESDIKA